jgi:uncharacterized protein YggE
MITRIYNKLQTREGITFVASVALMVATIGLILVVFGGHHFGGENTPGQSVPSIHVSGTGEVTASPDIATFSFSVAKDSGTIADARNQSSTIANALIAKLKTAGIDEKDIKTDTFSAYPKYENKASSISCLAGQSCPPVYNSVIVGYTVTNSYTVKVRNLDNVSAIAKLLTDTNISSLEGPNFSIDDAKALHNQAREKAIADAKAQAKVLADQLGVRLGDIVDFQVDDAQGVPPIPMRGMTSAAMDKAVAPDLPTGETKVTSTVSISYRIK